MRNAHKILVGKSEENIALRRPGSRRVEDIEMDLREMGWKDVDCIYVAQDGNKWQPLLIMVMNLFNFNK